MESDEFLKLEPEEIKKIIQEKQRPQNVTLMMDGTRRVLKLKEGHQQDPWLYEQGHIRDLIYKSVDVVDFLFRCGVNTVFGPLASIGNLNRKNFMPAGLECLLKPLTDDHCVSKLNNHQTAVSLYGDLEYAQSLAGGEVINYYRDLLSKMSSSTPSHHLAIGIGFSTERETELIANKAIDIYQRTGERPTLKDLVSTYFGFDAPPIDIFIRTNEMRASGGLTPLLTSPNTQWYVPVSPGIISLSNHTLKLILHDYLFNRQLSGGKHEHTPISEEESREVSAFYQQSKDEVLGIGRKVGDMWIHQSKR